MSTPAPDPLPQLIADLLLHPGLHPDTVALIAAAVEAQTNGRLTWTPELPSHTQTP